MRIESAELETGDFIYWEEELIPPRKLLSFRNLRNVSLRSTPLHWP